MSIHEYANELIYVLEYQIKGKYLRFYEVPALPIYVEQLLRYK